MNILLVEDEKQIASFIVDTLEAENHKVTTCESVEEVLKENYEKSHDLVILDLMLAGKTGEYLVRHVKKQKNTIPILVLSALSQISKKVELLNLGVDDYMTKPFDAEELIARINALYRRYIQTKQNEENSIGDLTFFRKQNRVKYREKEIFLTKKEGEVLDMLMHHNKKILRAEDLLMKVWQTKKGYHSNILQATIRRLRQKLTTISSKNYIKTVHGIGYMFIGEE